MLLEDIPGVTIDFTLVELLDETLVLRLDRLLEKRVALLVELLGTSE